MPLEKMMTFTTEANATDSLEHALDALIESKIDPMALKWFIIALHHATHCFMLAALAGSAQQGIWQEPIRYKKRDDGVTLIDVFDPKNRLLNFLDAYKRIKYPERMKSYIHSKPFSASDAHDEAMEFLNHDLRNTLIHFRPIVTGMVMTTSHNARPCWMSLNFCFLNLVRSYILHRVTTRLNFES